MSGHTPGPWVFMPLAAPYGRKEDTSQPDRWGVVQCFEDDPPLAEIGPHGTVEDARLIAAAPDLLEAAKRMQAYLWQAGVKAEAGSYNPLEDLAASLDVLIAKAEGTP
jgi:hypothetical protein